MQCSAKSKRSGKQHKKDAIPAKGVCYIHGGKTLKGADSRTYKHGKYSKSLMNVLGDNYHDPLEVLGAA